MQTILRAIGYTIVFGFIALMLTTFGLYVYVAGYLIPLLITVGVFALLALGVACLRFADYFKELRKASDDIERRGRRMRIEL